LKLCTKSGTHERTGHAEARDDEGDAEDEPDERLRDEVPAEPAEVRESLEQPSGEGERGREEQGKPEQRDRWDRQRERRTDERCGEHDRERRESGTHEDAPTPPPDEHVERRLLAARPILGGDARGGGLDHLGRQRLEDEDAE